MKTALLLLSLIASTTAAPKARVHDVSWSEVHAFIVAEATNADSWTEAELWAESVDGEKTWVILGTGAHARGVHPIDGAGLGWPRDGKEITFPTAEVAQECGTMIDEFRESQNR